MRYTNPTADAEYSQLLENPEKFPFSFVYNGEKIKGFPKKLFTLKEKSTDNSAGVERTTLVFDFDASRSTRLIWIEKRI